MVEKLTKSGIFSILAFIPITALATYLSTAGYYKCKVDESSASVKNIQVAVTEQDKRIVRLEVTEKGINSLQDSSNALNVRVSKLELIAEQSNENIKEIKSMLKEHVRK